MASIGDRGQHHAQLCDAPALLGRMAPARYSAELALPASEAVVIQFLVDHIQRKNKSGLVKEPPSAIDESLVAAGLKAKAGPLKLSTVVQRMAVLSMALKLKRLANPCELPSVRTLLSRARRAAVKRDERPTKKAAITRSVCMTRKCSHSLRSTPTGCNFLLDSWIGMPRRSPA